MSLFKPTATSSDEDLIKACRAGNQSAWEALVAKYKRLVYSIPAKFHLPPEDAADIFQSVWADLYRDLERLEEPNAVRGWLMTAAARRSLLFKKRRQLTTGELDSNIVDPAPDVVSIRAEAEREQIVREAVASLPPRCHRLVEMLFYEFPPRPYSEIAKLMGLAEGSIGFIRGRCLAKLKKAITVREQR